MNKLVVRWLITALALYVAVRFVPGISYDGDWTVLVGMALVFGLVNAVVRPVLSLLTCPFIIATLGLFVLVINGVMLLVASRLAVGLGVPFHVDGFGPAFWGALVVSVVSVLLNSLVVDEPRRAEKRQR
jgi:putative membrane protein